MKSTDKGYAAAQMRRKTKRGVLTDTYHHQIARSKNRGHPLPDYSLQTFHATFMECEIYNAIFNAWVAGGYIKADIPSIDRIDPLKPYMLSNIQVMTWAKNDRKGDLELITTRRTQAIMCDLNGKEIRLFDSTKEAARVSGCHKGLITACCKGQRNQTGGYKWKYGEKHRCKDASIYIGRVDAA